MGKPSRVAQAQLRALDRLRSVEALADFYLAGGTAIAFHLGHRQSLDLDLFSKTLDVDLDAVRAAVMEALPSTKVLGATDASLRVRCDDTPVDIVRYAYPPLDPPTPGPSAFPVATLRDLATMKLAAVARRGIRRDFWDLEEIARHGLSLADAATAYLERFGVAEADLYHVLRALTFFDDAEREPVLPGGLTPKRWAEIKRFFQTEAPKLLEAS